MREKDVIQSKGMAMLKALFVAYILTSIILFIMALLLYKLEPSNGVISVGIVFSYIFSSFVGGFMIGKKVTEKQFLWGILLGVLYFFVLFCISCLLNKDIFGQMGSVITVFFMCSLGGMLGGMIS